MLETILKSQKDFQKSMGIDFEKMNQKERSEYIAEHGYALIEEVVELRREMKYHKSWKNYDGWTQEEDEKQLQLAREESIDVLAFLANIFGALGMDAEMVMSMYQEKCSLNYERQENNY